MDKIPREVRSRNMAAIKGKDTSPEIFVRKLIYSLGYRYTVHRKDLPGNPDVVPKNRKIAIFVNGCFWHQHSGCKYASVPKSNTEFWNEKLKMNVERDKRNYTKLKTLGYKVIVIWECEIRNSIKNKNGKIAEKLREILGEL